MRGARVILSVPRLTFLQGIETNGGTNLNIVPGLDQIYKVAELIRRGVNNPALTEPQESALQLLGAPGSGAEWRTHPAATAAQAAIAILPGLAKVSPDMWGSFISLANDRIDRIIATEAMKPGWKGLLPWLAERNFEFF